MKSYHYHPELRWVLTLSGLMLGLILLTINFIQSGLSATWFVLLILVVGFVFQLFTLYKQQTRQIGQVIRALANGDSTLGLSSQHPMSEYFQQVKQQMQSARLKAEDQAQFLQTLLIHVDLAIIVTDEKGKIIESNPAVHRLIGTNLSSVSDLKHIGTLLLNSDKDRKFTAPWHRGDQEDTLSIQVSSAQIQGKLRKIVTMQSIHGELLNKEQQAYKRLTKVLTHEVANSITPLASIAETCKSLLPQSLQFSNEENKQDLTLALETMASRTQHLEEFIESFQSISRLPSPSLKPCDLSPLLQQIASLFHGQLKKSGIDLSLEIQNQQLVMIDKSQIEQVLINLIKNALEVLNQAQKPEPQKHKIDLVVGQNDAHQVYVDVIDSGPGVAEHVIDVMFVPFFTTKSEGSGIGLSLSRQIMINHGGDLVYIKRDKGSCFRCVFG